MKTLRNKLQVYMKQLNYSGKVVGNMTNLAILKGYYEHIGVTGETTMNEWFIGLAAHEFPPYTAVLGAIKGARLLHEDFRRSP